MPVLDLAPDMAKNHQEAIYSKSARTRPFSLEIPLEIREQILYHVFFPTPPLAFNRYYPARKLSPTEIYPYLDYNGGLGSFIGIAVLRACSQLFHEGEFVLYRHLRVNLMYHDWMDSGESTTIFLEKLHPRQRQLIRHVELKCISRSYFFRMPLCEWKSLMDFLATECYGLRTLILWCPGDYREMSDFLLDC